MASEIGHSIKFKSENVWTAVLKGKVSVIVLLAFLIFGFRSAAGIVHFAWFQPKSILMLSQAIQRSQRPLNGNSDMNTIEQFQFCLTLFTVKANTSKRFSPLTWKRRHFPSCKNRQKFAAGSNRESGVNHFHLVSPMGNECSFLSWQISESEMFDLIDSDQIVIECRQQNHL